MRGSVPNDDNAPAEHHSATNTQGLHAMSNGNTKNNSFSHAFLPGLILGLIIGAVAGAFLPDFLGGPKLPETTGTQHTGSHSGARDRDQELIDDGENMIDDMQEQGEDMLENAEDTVDDAIDEAENNLPTNPPSDG